MPASILLADNKTGELAASTAQIDGENTCFHDLELKYVEE